jgi:hypothetical protein
MYFNMKNYVKSIYNNNVSVGLLVCEDNNDLYAREKEKISREGLYWELLVSGIMLYVFAFLFFCLRNPSLLPRDTNQIPFQVFIFLFISLK